MSADGDTSIGTESGDAAWLEELLVLSVSLTEGADIGEATRRSVDVLARLLPARAVGACVALPTGAGQIVEVRMPSGAAYREERDPTRLFPSRAHERVLRAGDGPFDATLHVAGDDGAFIDPDTREARIFERVAAVLGGALRRARALEHAGESTRSLRRLQAHVIQAEKLASLGQIVAGVVHELNNPLTSIVAYSDYLRKKSAANGADADDVERLRRIGEAAERILRFSRDLVAYARPSNEIPGPVAIQEVIDKALVFCEHEFTEAKVEVSRKLAADTPPVRGVPGQLTQVFVNLFTNAAHAMTERGGALGVSSQAEGEQLRVDVSDEGSGIEPDALEMVFEPFYTTKVNGKGSGLGLSIVRDIVRAHGGKLSVQSVPGHGSVFSVVLPLIAEVPSSKA